MVYALEGLHLGKKVRLDAKVLPPDVPDELAGLEQICRCVDPLARVSIQSHGGKVRFGQLLLLRLLIVIGLYLLLVLNDYPVTQFVDAEPSEDRVFALGKLDSQLERALRWQVRVHSGLSTGESDVVLRGRFVARVFYTAALSVDGPVRRDDCFLGNFEIWLLSANLTFSSAHRLAAARGHGQLRERAGSLIGFLCAGGVGMLEGLGAVEVGARLGGSQVVVRSLFYRRFHFDFH